MLITKGNEHPEENLAWAEDPSVTWRVLRTDDHGNVFTVRRDLSHADATALHDELTRRGHKQTYEMKPTYGR